MRRATRSILAAAIALATASQAAAQLVYDWDGETSDSWFVTTNWEVFGGNPDPGLGDPPIPDGAVRVEIDIDGTGATPAPVVAGGAALASEVRIGRTNGGALTLQSGSLSTAAGDSGVKFRVGNGAPGAFTMNGGTLDLIDGTFVTGSGANSKGTVEINGGVLNVVGASRDINLDENNPSAGSVFTVNDGQINIGDVFLIDGTATFNLLGGSVSSIDDIRLRADAVANVSGGLWVTQDALQVGEGAVVGGALLLTGGTVRAENIDFGGDGTIAIDSLGLLQLQNTNVGVAAAEAFILGGRITSSGTLEVSVVDIGGIDFTQISVQSAGLPGDFNGDGKVDLVDLDILGQNFGVATGATLAQGDANGDGAVDLVDLDILGQNFGAMAATATPEPAALFVAAIGVLAAAARRR